MPTMPNTLKSRNKHRTGAVLVEFAFTCPILFLLLFASIEFMRVNTIINSMENAAYEGARRAIVPGATADQARAEAQSILDAIGVRDATIDVQPAQIDLNTPEVTVLIDVPASPNSFVASSYFVGKTFSKSCTLTREVEP